MPQDPVLDLSSPHGPKKDKSRVPNPCDGCALRRVRCEGGRPCQECQKRCLDCTNLRVSRKRGPKGPRQRTSQKIRSWQRDFGTATGTTAISEARFTPQAQQTRIGPVPKYTPLPLETYCKFLDLFRQRLYSVWPVLCCKELISSLVSNEQDNEAWALGASLCAAVIAQLRLPEHCQPPASSCTAVTRDTTSHEFAKDACHFRECYNFRGRPSVSSLLTSFFLHVYYANSEHFSTAAFYLRESLTHAHMLGLHRPATYPSLPPDQRELRLRAYWVLFVSERTYCIQHGLPTILHAIHDQPSPDERPDGSNESPILSFLRLTKMFTFLDGDLIEPPLGTATTFPGKEQQRARNRVALFQTNLSTTEGVGLDETQEVDIFVTRNWIRILLWEYALRHFRMACTSKDQAFSMLLPAFVAHEMLGLFSAVSDNSICAHGYGMELKVFRIADCLLDVLSCGRLLSTGMLVGSRDALHSLEKVLSTVGGTDSAFLSKLRNRMAEVELPVASRLQLDWTERQDSARQVFHDESEDQAAWVECSDIQMHGSGLNTRRNN